MELKYFVVLAVLGAASGFKIPEGSPESSFPSTYTENNPSTATAAPLLEEFEGTIRNKRHLFFKKGKGQSEHRQYEQGVIYEQRPNREVHHHHHYSNNPRPQPPTTYVGWGPRPVPTQQEFQHYHGYNQGGYANQGSGYYSGSSAGGYYNSKPNYGNGWAQPGPQREAGPVGAAPVGTGHNAIDRGQGAAAVNNIAIIHARAGVSSHNGPEESPKSSDIDFAEFSRQALGLD